MLPHVLRRAPDVPCVVVVKGDNRHASVEQAKAEFGELVLEVVYEELLLRPTTVMRRWWAQCLEVTRWRHRAARWRAAMRERGVAMQQQGVVMVALVAGQSAQW